VRSRLKLAKGAAGPAVCVCVCVGTPARWVDQVAGCAAHARDRPRGGAVLRRRTALVFAAQSAGWDRGMTALIASCNLARPTTAHTS
jgi:hypothetical protein